MIREPWTPLKDKPKITVREVYQNIFTIQKYWHVNNGMTEDKANRLANIHAIKNTWIQYNKYFK